jgi:hypothetical protein
MGDADTEDFAHRPPPSKVVRQIIAEPSAVLD